MKTIALLLLLTCTSFTAHAQKSYTAYYLLIDSAQHLKSLDRFDQAIEVYEAAFAEFAGLGGDYLSLAGCYLQTDRFDEVENNLKAAITRGVPQRYLDRIRREEPGEQEQRLWAEIDTAYPRLRKEFYQRIDLDAYLQLQMLKQSDQQIRRYLMSDPAYQSDTLLRKYAGEIDSVNLATLLSIIAENDGVWPGFKSFGDAESGAYYVLLHLSPDYFADAAEYRRVHAHLYEVAKEGVRRGELTPFQFAYWVDYHAKAEEGVQVYGVPAYRNWEKLPFKNQSAIERLRREIGLPSLKTLYARQGETPPAWYQD